VGLRRAANSFGRGFADASAARAGEVGVDVMAAAERSELGAYKCVLGDFARGSCVLIRDGGRENSREVFVDAVVEETQIGMY
jgi:hypothetical protein